MMLVLRDKLGLILRLVLRLVLRRALGNGLNLVVLGLRLVLRLALIRRLFVAASVMVLWLMRLAILVPQLPAVRELFCGGVRWCLQNGLCRGRRGCAGGVLRRHGCLRWRWRIQTSSCQCMLGMSVLNP
jgi:hypothetical protein